MDKKIPPAPTGLASQVTHPQGRVATELRFPKSRRLLKRGDFLAVRKEGSAKGGRYLVIGVLADPRLDTFQLGLVTTKRCGGAVVRNRLRRLMREVVRLDQHGIRGGVKITLVARHTAAGANFHQLQMEWRRLARKAGLLARADRPPKVAMNPEDRSTPVMSGS
jgi:ribonuclease P protein component